MDRDPSLSSPYHRKGPKTHRHRDIDSLWTEVRPSQVHITDRDLNPNRHRHKDDLWTEIRPSHGRITERDSNPNLHRGRDSLWSEIWPSRVRITERDWKSIDIGIRAIYGLRSGHLQFISLKGTQTHRHRYIDSLWTEIWPSQGHITDRDLKPNRHRDKDDLCHRKGPKSQST